MVFSGPSGWRVQWQQYKLFAAITLLPGLFVSASDHYPGSPHWRSYRRLVGIWNLIWATVSKPRRNAWNAQEAVALGACSGLPV